MHKEAAPWGVVDELSLLFFLCLCSCLAAIDELSLDASCGSLEAAIMSGELEDAAGQVLFLQVREAKALFQ